MGWFDLHSHVLAGLDDGAPDATTSQDMLKGLSDLGFDTVCATPHQRAGMFMPDAAAIAEAHGQARESAAGFGLDLRLAAENMWDDVFFDRTQQGAVPGYRSGPDEPNARAFLVELPIAPTLPVGLFDYLFQIQMTGLLPVLAHPERYQPLWKDWQTVEKLAGMCAFVIDLGALAGYHGRKQGKFAKKLVAEGVAHAVASDAHSVNDVRIAAEGIAWLRKKHGDDAVARLLEHNPRRIYDGEHPA